MPALNSVIDDAVVRMFAVGQFACCFADWQPDSPIAARLTAVAITANLFISAQIDLQMSALLDFLRPPADFSERSGKARRTIAKRPPNGKRMAVYTEVSFEDLEALLAGYDIGAPLSFKGIAEGVENSNFHLQTERGSYILTLYEKRVREADLPFFLGLMEHLTARGIACPQPVRRRDGAQWMTINGRPAALVSFLNGLSLRRPDVSHCAAAGDALARLHAAGKDFAIVRPNALGLDG